MARLFFNPRFRAFDEDGEPLAGGKLYTYESGTTTPRATYSDAAGLTPNANPVILDANGEATIFTGAVQYKVILKDAADVTQWTIDPYNGNLSSAEDGIDGRTINYGSGAPAGGTGNDGDFYLNTANYDFYGPKASGSWPAPVSLTGSADAAAASEAAAAASEAAAAASASAASTSASTASTAATNAQTAETNAETAETNAEAAEVAAEAARDAALAAQAAAEASEDAAAASETNAAASAAAAATFDPAEYVRNGGFIYVDETNDRLGIGVASPTYRFHFRAGADDYAQGMALDHASGGANSLWRFYPDLNATISLYNPNQATTVFSMISTEQQLRLNEGGSDGGAVNIRNATGKTAHHTLVLKKLASQTGDFLRMFSNDGVTVLAKIDIAGAGTLSALTVDGTEVSGLIRQNSKSAAYTTVLSDGGKHIYHPSSDNNARTFTIDSNANVAYPIGTAITFVNRINTVTIAITSDTMYLAGTGSTGLRTLAAHGVATAIKTGTTEWYISGTGLT